MANAVEDALSRASAEQRAAAEQTIQEARRNIQLVSVRQVGDMSSSDAASVSRSAEIIEEAKRNIPFDTMQDVDTVSPPLATPSARTYSNSNVIEIHSQTLDTIENIEQGEGNNYLRENAVDRAMSREGYRTEDHEQQRAMGR